MHSSIRCLLVYMFCGLMSLAGCWADDPEDAARMEAAIKDGRKNVFMREINLDD